MKVTVQTRDVTTAMYEAGEGERLLQAGISKGVGLPHECATGTCGMCKAKVVTGEVVPLWPAAPGNTTLKPEKGQILLCQSAIKSDCTISVSKAENYKVSPSYREGSIRSIISLTQDVVFLQVELAEPLPFEPGQFVTLEAPGVEGPRAYSLANHPGSEVLEFLIKRKMDGGMTSWIFNHAIAGNKVRVFGAIGRAHLRPTDKHVVLISGSSGLSSTLSILRSASDRLGQFKTDVYFGVRTPSDIFFAEELAEFAKQYENVNVTICLSDAGNTDCPTGPVITMAPRLKLKNGFVHEVLAANRVEDLPNTTAFIAGPPPMVDAVIRTLMTDWRLPISNIRYDKFN